MASASFSTEVYLLVSELLASRPETRGAFEALRSDLGNQNDVLQPRYDWQGNAHPQSLDQLRASEQQRLSRPDQLISLAHALATKQGLRSLLAKPQSGSAANAADGHHQHALGVLRSRSLGSRPQQMSCSMPKVLYSGSQMGLRKRTLGHLAPVFCLLFNRAGTRIFTGADDLLVKCWLLRDGRLVQTFRGASAEITDLATCPSDRLLAAGSNDKIVRIWCQRTAAPVAILSKHTSTITAIRFCPQDNFLASTSHDGSVAFWRYSYENNDGIEQAKVCFEETPTRFHEKIRPGHAQMICGAFSAGGTFFAVGSMDHHVRVYQMEPINDNSSSSTDWPRRILEEAAHEDRVDSISWCHNASGLKFVSGSKDGTARIWSFRHGVWVTTTLNMKANKSVNAKKTSSTSSSSNQEQSTSVSSGRRRTATAEANSSEATNGLNDSVASSSSNGVGANSNAQELRVTMVAWSLDDSMVITAVSDCSLRLWDASKGMMLRLLKGHEEEIYVLEPHPLNSTLFLSAAHDGNVCLWDLQTGNALYKHKNLVNSDESNTNSYASFFDAKWAPDGLSFAASDSHGHILIFGRNYREHKKKNLPSIPDELFFHTDYRPLLRDSFHFVVDEQTQIPPHLLPPPLLVDAEGSPYPAILQRLVPGRENMNERDALIPMVGRLHQERSEQPREDGQEENGSGNRRQIDEHNYATHRENEENPPIENGRLDNENGQEGEQLPIELILNANHSDQNLATRMLFNPKADKLIEQIIKKQKVVIECHNSHEKESFERETKVSTHEHQHTSRVGHTTNKTSTKKKRNTLNSNRRRERQTEEQDQSGVSVARGRDRAQEDEQEDEEENDNDDNAEENDEGSVSDCSLDESDLSGDDSTTELSSDHSDWGNTDDEANRVEEGGSQHSTSRSQETKKSRRKALSKDGKSKGVKTKKKEPRRAAARCIEANGIATDDLDAHFMPSPWLSSSMPRRSPYFPQIGDNLVYFREGHVQYMELVKKQKVYNISQASIESIKRSCNERKDGIPVKVLELKFEIRPPRLCILKLAVLNSDRSAPTEETIVVKYHDMNNVVDFLVLIDALDHSLNSRQWRVGDNLRCQIDDRWWMGTVKNVKKKRGSPFLSIECEWRNGDTEWLSPWDIETFEEEEDLDGTLVSQEELKHSLHFDPVEEEWNGSSRERECHRLLEALDFIMSLSAAEPFNFPVDLTAYPQYMMEVAYPMDFSLIKARLENRFYRRISAIEFDAKHIYRNAAKFNRPRSDIVRDSKIITDLFIEILNDRRKGKREFSRLYHNAVDNFDWDNLNDNDAEDDDPGSESQDEERTKQRNSRHRRQRRSSSKSRFKLSSQNLNPKKWKHDCNLLLNEMVANPLSEPFREPVSEIEHPSYHRYVTTPMDLSTVRELLHSGEYESPLDFNKDVQLIFKNSTVFNTDPTSKILSMTKKLREWFDERMPEVTKEWRLTLRRLTLAKRKHKLKAKSNASKQESRSKGKGKGKGKGASNNIRKRRYKSDDDESENVESEEDERKGKRDPLDLDSSSHHEIESSEVEEDDDKTFQTKASVPSSAVRHSERRHTSLTKPAKHETKDDSKASTSRVFPKTKHQDKEQPRPSTSTAIDESSDEELSVFETSPRRRTSSSVQNSPKKTPKKTNLTETSNGIKRQASHNRRVEEDDNEDVTLSSASILSSTQRQLRPSRNIKEESSDEDEEDEDYVPTKKRRRAIVSEKKAKVQRSKRREESSQSEEAMLRPKRKRKPLKNEMFVYSTDEEEDEVEEEAPLRRQSKKSKRSIISIEETEEDDDDDDVPLARRMVHPPRRLQEKHIPLPSKSNLLSEESEDDLPLSRSSRKKTRKHRKESSEEEQDEENEESEESSSSSSSSSSQEEDEEDAWSGDDNGTARRNTKVRPMRRAEPKANTSRRAAAAIDSESEHISTRRPSRPRRSLADNSTSDRPRRAAAAHGSKFVDRGSSAGESDGEQPKRASHRR